MYYKRKPSWCLALFWVIIMMLITKSVKAEASLVYFSATPQDGQVLLEWETVTEIANDGFYINRSLTENSGYSRVSPLIPSQGGNLTGAIYQYYDTGVANGVVYWYLLEAVNQDQSTEFYQPPISAVPRSQTKTSTPTGTITISATPIGSATPTNTSTATRTMTSTPTLVRTSLADTPTAPLILDYPAPETQANTNTMDETILLSEDETEATSTLIPMPEISIVFPTQATELSKDMGTNRPDSNLSLTRSDNKLALNVQSLLTLGVVTLGWVILGGIYFLTSRQADNANR